MEILKPLHQLGPKTETIYISVLGVQVSTCSGNVCGVNEWVHGRLDGWACYIEFPAGSPKTECHSNLHLTSTDWGSCWALLAVGLENAQFGPGCQSSWGYSSFYPAGFWSRPLRLSGSTWQARDETLFGFSHFLMTPLSLRRTPPTAHHCLGGAGERGQGWETLHVFYWKSSY